MKKSQLQSLIRKRSVIKSRITTFKNYIDEFNDDIDITNIKVRLAKVAALFEEYDEIQTQIEENDEPDQESRTDFEESYYNVIALAECIIESRAIHLNSTNNLNQTQSPQNKSHIKLPTISLQEFNGKYEHWTSFYDNFMSLIHNNDDLSNVQRLHYLKSSVRGEASNIIQSLESTNQNYEIAWSMLKERYENKRLIIQTHMNALFNLPTISRESHSTLRQLLDSVSQQLRALTSLGEPVQHWDTIIIHLITSKLDNQTRREWESCSVNYSPLTLENLTVFLKGQCQMLEALDAAKQGRNKSASVITHKNKSPSTSFLSTATTSTACFMCKENHYLFLCDKFLKLSVPQRISEAQKLKLCLNCLRNNHTTKECRSPKTCKTCQKQHNSLLHLPDKTIAPKQETSHETEPESKVCSHLTTFNQVLLATALVDVLDAEDKPHIARVLLDAGSQINFITQALSHQLQLKTYHIKTPVIGINHTITQATHSINATIKSRTTAFLAKMTFIVLDKITTNLPLVNISTDSLKIPASINLADPNFYHSGPIDMLLGAEIFWSLMSVGQIKLAKNQPFLQKTLLGWIVSGKYIPESRHSSNEAVCNLASQDSLSDQIEKFWTIEQENERKYLTKDDQRCEQMYIATTTRNSDGRFVVELPFKCDPSTLGESKEVVMKRFLTLERKMQNNHELKIQYSKFLQEYIQLGHMKPITENDEIIKPHFYLPHHAVFKAESTTTKLRVVFDGSCKSSSGVSLNDCLLVGPQIQEDLINILARFRTHKYVIAADVQKMYRQIEVTPNHTHFQRIIWRMNQSDQLQTYVLTTVTYGTAAASFLAIRSLTQTAIQYQETHPETSAVIKRDFYVDDLISGVNTISEGLVLIKELTDILKSGGFELHKWKSNESSLLFPRPTENHSSTLELDKEMPGKLLGMTWYSTDDLLKYSAVEQQDIKVTKRAILSRISRIFDPLGLIGPVLTSAKLLLQKLWQLKADWDESVPENIHTEWINYSNQLQYLNNLSITRRITQDDTILTTIHGFSDASESAYGACLYLQTTNGDGKVKTALVCGKSRVAPLKCISLPRLELCGAQLLVQLYQKIIPTLGISIHKHYYWTDSTIVLAWIKSESTIWKTFVANRVGEIQEHTRSEDWNYVKSEDNPADLLSRGINPSTIGACELWWNGPLWLQENEHNWPNLSDTEDKNEVLLERKTVSLLTIPYHENNELLTRFSSFVRLQRVISYCFRFSYNAKRSKLNRKTGPLHPEEINQATIFITRTTQQEAFPADIAHLQKFNKVHRQSKLLALNPFLDKDELMRVGGRLDNSSLPFSTKHPIILPQKHVVTKMIIRNKHESLCHAGATTTLANIRQKYWPIAGLVTIKAEIRKCIKCFRVNPSRVQYLMGQLPQPRVDPQSRAFVETGLDYCGPIAIREGNRRSKKTVKAYIAIFVCFATKAMHLEIVLDLSTEAFLNALKRFMGRRGKPNTIHSDNGTNFVGANRELTEFLDSPEFKNSAVVPIQQEGITWKFIPPRSPHFGGLWESGVKSFKTHFKRTVGNALLTYEELSTIIIQIEACLNSRPLTPLSTDPNDFSVLTPSHFLIGDLLTSPMEHDIKNINENRLTRWQRVQQINQHFWSRWSSEYITQLQQRTKWKNDTGSVIKEGSLVIIRDDQQPPLRWNVGRVICIHPGKDGITRTATVRTARGNFLRPSRKLCLLPMET